MSATRLSIFDTLIALARGQSLARICMNHALRDKTLRGTVMDVGGGRDPDYFEYLGREGDVTMLPVDASFTGIDFEHDPLPSPDASVTTVLCCNVLEHIYNYQFLLKEMRRVLCPFGTLIGFVPFWTGHHPDPHDYFRYTDEALVRMLTDSGYRDIVIEPVAVGPLLANFNTIVLSMPRVLRPLAYLWYAFWNWLFLLLRPESRKRNPLGYIFTAHA